MIWFVEAAPETEAVFTNYKNSKAQLTARVNASASSLENSCLIYRSLRLPLIAPPAAAILRQADRMGLLGNSLIVVGTNAMLAYSLEATLSFEGEDVTTDDFDMAWTGSDNLDLQVVWPMLKKVDDTYTVNTERPFQARNAKGFEFELLTAPSKLATASKRDRPSPLSLPEQEWLLNGRFIDHVVVARDGSPARLIVPDPRWFALQKCWMAEQAKRDPAKRSKDARQGKKLLEVVAARMPQFLLNEDFEAELPDELRPFYDNWKNSAGHLPPKARNW